METLPSSWVGEDASKGRRQRQGAIDKAHPTTRSKVQRLLQSVKSLLLGRIFVNGAVLSGARSTARLLSPLPHQRRVRLQKDISPSSDHAGEPIAQSLLLEGNSSQTTHYRYLEKYNYATHCARIRRLLVLVANDVARSARCAPPRPGCASTAQRLQRSSLACLREPHCLTFAVALRSLI